MNNEITEELAKRFIEEYGEDEWRAVAPMSYPYLVELCLTLRRQMRWASEGRLWEKDTEGGFSFPRLDQHLEEENEQ